MQHANAEHGHRPSVAGISISHPRRVLDPAGITKLDLARYYERIAARMLPHVALRPLSLLRWAEGKATEKGGIFLRHARAWGPRALKRIRIREKTKVGEYLVIEDAASLVALAQMDVLEIHTWNSTEDRLECPDRVVFDLDPGPGVSFPELVENALLLREALLAVGLRSWVKTTGGNGLHVMVPLVPEAGWDACFAFTRAFAEAVSGHLPDRFVATRGASNRRGRTFIDYFRNNRTATSVAAFSTRARPGAPVSVPLSWKELEAKVPLLFDVKAALARKADPWRGYWTTKQKLP